jgi:hypothetical protein
MTKQPKGPEAVRIRQRKFELLRKFEIPDNLLPGSLSIRYSHCNMPNCHCAKGEGHPLWSLTFMVDSKKHVQHIPKHLVEDVHTQVQAGREFQDAVQFVRF